MLLRYSPYNSSPSDPWDPHGADVEGFPSQPIVILKKHFLTISIAYIDAR